MAAGQFTLFKNYRDQQVKGGFDLDAAVDGSLDTLYIALFGSGMSAALQTATTYADISAYEVSGSGYTAGGAKLAGGTVTNGTNELSVTFTAATWAMGATITPYYAVVYKNSGSKYLVGYFLLDSTPAALTVNNGQTLTVNFGSALWKLVSAWT